MLYEIIEIIELIDKLNKEQLLDVQRIINGRLERMEEKNDK